MSTIYWKFKNTKSEFSSITFDSTHVSILDLKRAIIKQKKLQQTPHQPFDLSIINAHTGVEYTDETGPIPRNLAVIVRRLPAARNQHKKLWAPLQNNSVIATADNISKKQIQTISERLNHEFGPALFNDSKTNGSGGINGGISAEVDKVETETMNIIDMMNRRMNNGTTTVIDSNKSSMMRNKRHMNHNNNMNNKDGKQSYRSQRGDPPPGYICHRCHVSGHWIQDCPTNGDPKFDKKNRSQTLRSNLPVPKPATPTNISGDTTNANIGTQQVIVGRKCYQIPTNVYESFNGDHSKIKAYIEISSGTNNYTQQQSTQGNGVSSKYQCEICHGYYIDARYTPCCRVTYCNECIRGKSLYENPSMIRCPSCEEIFRAESLDISQNTKLQEKVDKIVAQQKKQNAQMKLSSIDIPTNKTITTTNITTNTTTKTIQIPTPHTITIPQPQIMGHKPVIRPTVILQQSPPSHVYKPIAPTITVPTPTMHNTIHNNTVPGATTTPTIATVLPIDTTRLELKTTIPTNNMNYICIECNERGHKYKDCPKVAEKKNISQSDESNNDNNSLKIEPKLENKSDLNTIQSLKDDGLDRIPKKTEADIKPIINATKPNISTQTITTPTANTNPTVNPPLTQSVLNPNLLTLNHGNRIAPQVQLINNTSNASTLTGLNNLNALSAINSVNMMNIRNRMNLNNILMNAALHNAQRRTGGISPRLINSANPLLNPALAIGRMPNARNGLALLQQQSLLSQQAALNRLRTLQSLSPTQIQTQQQQQQHSFPQQQTLQQQQSFNMSSIPPEILQSTINELKQVMSSSDPSAVTNAINNAFIKLGANDPDSKRLVLQQLVTTIGNVAKANNNNNNDNNVTNNNNIISNAQIQTNDNNNILNTNEINKKTKKKHKKSKSKSKKKKRRNRDKDGHKKRSKDRKHRHSKRRDRERRRDRKRDRETSRSRSRSRDKKDIKSSNDEYNTNDTHSSMDNDDDNTIIHVVDVQTVTNKKRKLPPAPMPDFTLSPPPNQPNPTKKHKTNQNQSNVQ